MQSRLQDLKQQSTQLMVLGNMKCRHAEEPANDVKQMEKGVLKSTTIAIKINVLLVLNKETIGKLNERHSSQNKLKMKQTIV